MLRTPPALCTNQRDSSKLWTELWTELAGDAAHSSMLSGLSRNRAHLRPMQRTHTASWRQSQEVLQGCSRAWQECNECRAHKVAGYEGAAAASRIKAHMQRQQPI